MKIIIKVKTRAKNESIERITNNTLSLLDDFTKIDTYKVSIKEPPIDGKANKAIIRVVAKYFNVALSRVEIISGLTSKIKIIKIQ